MNYINIYIRVNSDVESNLDKIDDLILTNKYFEPVIKKSPSFTLEKDLAKCLVSYDRKNILQHKFGCYSGLFNKVLNDKKVQKILENKIKKYINRQKILEFIRLEKVQWNYSDSDTDSDDSSESTKSINYFLEKDDESSGLDTDSDWD